MKVVVQATMVALARLSGQIADAHPVTDPDLGSHWPMATLFHKRPQAAVPTQGSSCEIASDYVDIVESGGGVKIVPLFAADAEFLGPEERVLRGRGEISAFYAKVPKLVLGAVPISFVDRGNECFMELAVRSQSGPTVYRLLAIDHFTIDKDRRISRLVIYFRPSGGKEAAQLK
ncbi:nuclear transport factor 2 family protein [Sphingobium sp.]|uniref:nuclear transport factor 2 family protein n=1 Tax=Sphingobium sp. TaxID=1912891 RepID=UPI002BB91CE1|nr:hypothetical protein [Sphingobium sp.]HUD90849.1 hypothetical protein [Sphingobium sp.]